MESGGVLPQPQVGVAAFIIKGEKMLLGKRRSVATCDATYALPGGHLEFVVRFNQNTEYVCNAGGGRGFIL
ncbi:hypothetical protein ACLOJK_001457 [Asimina triloba]